MIYREDMLELTRRMNLERTSFTRIAGAYFDEEGYVDGTFNTNFLKLTPAERKKNLALFKTVPFGKTNEELKEYSFTKEALKGKDTIWRLLMAMKSSGLKNDAFLDIFYEQMGAVYPAGRPYALFLIQASYDVPKKAKDDAYLADGEEVFEFLIGVIAPLEGEYEPGRPDCGFLFPAFKNRCADLSHINIYHADPEHPHREWVEAMLG
ncbi:MAG: DUF4317 family protein [Lachnospiraceae bacterium]|nr:DUF4317 family protein [Lachnospiraceae bacterium]